MTHSPSQWQRLKQESRVSFKLGLPIALGQLASMAMSIVDTLLAGQHGSITLAAVAIGSAIWSLSMLICIGLMMAIPPTVSQLNGAGKRAEIAPIWRQALWLAVFVGILLFVFMRWSPQLLVLMQIEEAVRLPAAEFLHAVSWGAPGLALFFATRYLSEGLAWTQPTLVFGVVALILLVPVGSVLLFGYGPIPEMGAAGLGYATALIMWLEFIAFAVYLHKSVHFSDLGLLARFEWPKLVAIKQLLVLGVPMGIAIFMEGSLFVATALFIGQLGAVDVAAHQIALNVASASFMIPLGIALATTVRVGHAVGARDYSAVRWAMKAGLFLVLITQTLSAIMLIFAGNWISSLYTDDAAIASLASTLMVYAALFQYPDGIQALSGGALRGLKDTKIPMFITVFAYWAVGLSAGLFLGMNQGLRAPGFWLGLTIGLSVAAVLLFTRFWHRLNKIEQA
ncbi:MAG TPA: MATE family efflux transporter [Arenimonas sp.]|nr:MATE family efflux transporter [Arenimonas sp.]